MRARASGERRTSASANTSSGWRAWPARTWHACCLPHQPGGSGGATRSRRRGSRCMCAATIAAVRSVEPSSSTTTSRSTPSLARAVSSEAPMLLSSSRAGISSETLGCGAGPRGGGARKTARLTAVITAGSTASASAAYARISSIKPRGRRARARSARPEQRRAPAGTGRRCRRRRCARAGPARTGADPGLWCRLQAHPWSG